MVKIRLARHGAKKKPFYRIIVTDSRSPRDGRFIEQIGYYDPTKQPSVVEIKKEKLDRWLQHGAQPSEPVAQLIKKIGREAAACIRGGERTP
jgi:small subunit ribosomal protein S16